MLFLLPNSPFSATMDDLLQLGRMRCNRERVGHGEVGAMHNSCPRHHPRPAGRTSASSQRELCSLLCLQKFPGPLEDRHRAATDAHPTCMPAAAGPRGGIPPDPMPGGDNGDGCCQIQLGPWRWESMDDARREGRCRGRRLGNGRRTGDVGFFHGVFSLREEGVFFKKKTGLTSSLASCYATSEQNGTHMS